MNNTDKSIYDIRLENFELLIQEAGSVANLARACGYDKPTYFYQVRKKITKSNGQIVQIGNRLATKLEQSMNKPAGWLDMIHHHNNNIKNNPDNQKSKIITLALTGASGMPYGIRLLEKLLKLGQTVWLLYSPSAQIVAQQEMNFKLPSNTKEAQKLLCQELNVPPEYLRVFGREEWFAPLASGTNVADAMVICPASMGTVAAVAHGLSDNLIERAADVMMKERRPLIIVPRETPFSTLHLENLLKLSQLGCTILPPAAGFYNHPQTVDDMIDFVVARILDQLRINHQIMKKWGE